MFERIDVNDDKELSFRVECSMLEIYNERIRDLFVPFSHQNEKKLGGLKLRDSPSLGVVVEGLKSSPVSSYSQIDLLMAQGTKNRTIAATNMNETSSRAHTIFMVRLTQTRVTGSAAELKAVERTSIINLVDLAGSERQKGSGAEGDRLKEAGAINKSLSVLGNVISALAFNASLASESDARKRRRAEAAAAGGIGTGTAERHIPYRDSVLTHLLRNSLGGNARTTMLAAISPADINFDETLSTLKYADRAKQIRNKPVVNEGLDERLIRELKEQVGE
jgi:kinesin family protein 1